MKLMSILLGMSLLFASGCAITEVDETADFTQYETFGWGKSKLDSDNPAFKSGLIRSNIRKTFEAEFEKKGITYSRRNPDILVSYHTYTEAKQEIPAFDNYSPSYPKWNLYPYRGDAMVGEYEPSYRYTEGTLIIDITDRKSGAHIWRGLVRGSVDDLVSLERHVARGVKAIVKKYPGNNPKANSSSLQTEGNRI